MVEGEFATRKGLDSLAPVVFLSGDEGGLEDGGGVLLCGCLSGLYGGHDRDPLLYCPSSPRWFPVRRAAGLVFLIKGSNADEQEVFWIP